MQHEPRCQIKPEMREKYLTAFARNDDPYGRRCFTFAEGWAAKMEAEIRSRSDQDPAAVICAVAEQCASDEDTDGISGSMYGVAVQILADAWVHGPALLSHHNAETQICGEGEVATAQGRR